MHPLKNLGYFAWYIDENITDVSEITNPDTIENLNIAKNLDIIVRPVFRNAERLMYENKSSYESIVHIFANDGLFYRFPYPSSSDHWNFSSIQTDVYCLEIIGVQWSPLCSYYFLDAQNSAEINNRILYVGASYARNLTAFLLDIDNSVVIDVCYSILDESSLVKMMTCINANISDLTSHLQESSLTRFGEFTVLAFSEDGSIGDVLLRGGSDFSQKEFYKADDKSSLIYWEFGVCMRYNIILMFFLKISQRQKKMTQMFSD